MGLQILSFHTLFKKWRKVKWAETFLFVFCCFAFLRQDLSSVWFWLFWSLLCRPGWPYGHRDPLAFARPPPHTVGTKLFSIWEKKKNLFYSFIFFKATSIDVQGGTCLWWELLWVRGRRIVSFRSVWITWWDPVLKKGHQCHARLCSAVQRSKICVSALSYFKV